MFNPNNIFDAIFIIPILNAMVAIYQLLLFVKIPGAFGFALIILTSIIKLILNPLTGSQIKSTRKLALLKPELDKLNVKYKNDKTMLHQEQLKLYQQAGINPAAGCLPLLIQMPILIALYNIFFKLLDSGDIVKTVTEINKVVYLPLLKLASLDLSFFGLSLTLKPSEWQSKGIWLLTIPIVTGLLQYWQTKMMSPVVKTTDNKQPLVKAQDKQITKVNEKKEDDMSTAMQKQMSIMMPVMIGFFAYSFPLGLSLYWNTFTIFGIIQQYQLSKETDGKNGKS